MTSPTREVPDPSRVVHAVVLASRRVVPLDAVPLAFGRGYRACVLDSPEIGLGRVGWRVRHPQWE